MQALSGRRAMHDRKSDSITLHDFRDGNGRVPAHHHPFGNGWVANSAYVEDTVYIGKNAQIFGNATVKDDVLVTDYAQISGFSIVRDHACVRGNAVLSGSCTIQDSSEISGDSFINRHIVVKGHLLLKQAHLCAGREDCLNCPALLDDNYGATRANPCLYCIKKMKTRRHLTFLFRPACRPASAAKA